jgi:hypothetical protein
VLICLASGCTAVWLWQDLVCSRQQVMQQGLRLVVAVEMHVFQATQLRVVWETCSARPPPIATRA